MTYRVTTDKKHLDFDKVYQFISNSYWASGIPKHTLEKALSNSLCFMLLNEDEQLVGFARMVTDKATFAYLADVFVDPLQQGQGLGKILIEQVMAHPELQGLRRIMLATKDAHSLYQRFGFDAVGEDASRLMQIRRPNIYQEQS